MVVRVGERDGGALPASVWWSACDLSLSLSLEAVLVTFPFFVGLFVAVVAVVAVVVRSSAAKRRARISSAVLLPSVELPFALVLLPLVLPRE